MANDSREVDCQVDLHGRIGCVAGAPVADRSALLYCGSVQQSKAALLVRQKRDEREYLEVEPLMVT